MPPANPALVAIVFLLGLTGCTGQTRPGASPQPQDPIAALRTDLSSIRQLCFTEDVPVVIETPDQLKNYLDADLQQGMEGKKLDDISLAYKKLGLLPRGTDLRKGQLGFYSTEAMAFYDSKTKKIVLLGRPNRRADGQTSGGSDERVLAHEFTHALQDQHFQVGARLRHSDNGDASLALRAVAEGDAILTEYAFSFGGLSDWLPGYVAQVFGNPGENAAVATAPMIVADRVQFQYSAGVRFVSHFVGNDGWHSVDVLYSHPPLSTEQVLHPEKYFEAPDPPVQIELHGLAALFSPGWREIDNDTLGELMVHCLFKQFLSPEEAAAVAEGWGGDRFLAYRNGEKVAFIWATVWDTAKDAQEFYENYQRILSMKYGDSVADSRSYVEKRDRSVIVVEGLEAEQVKKNIGAFWASIITKRETFQPPPVGSSVASH
jgi:hypothetical protein